MRITGSCGIRLACPSCLLAVVVSVLRAMCGLVPPLVPSGVSPLAPACLMFAAVCLDASPRHLIISCLAACRSLRASARASSRWPRHRCRCLCCYRSIASRYPPRLIDTTGGEIRRCCGGSLGFACLPIGSPSHPCVRHRMATGFGACLVILPLPVSAPWPSSMPPANRSLAQSDFLAALSSCRLIALPPRSLDTGDGAGVYLRGFCVLRRRGLPCLLGCRIIYFVDGGCGSATVRVRPLICLDAPVHPLFVMSSRISIPRLDAYSGSGFASILSLPVDLPLFFRRVSARSPDYHGDGSRHFYAYPSCGELDETARADFGVNSIGLALPSPGFSRSFCLGASAGASCSPFISACLPHR